MRFLSSLSPFQILRQLGERKESSTFERLKSSQHVADLRLIFSVTLIIMIAASVLAVLFCFEHQVMTNWKAVETGHDGWIWAQLVFAAIGDSGAFIGAVGALGCGVLAWTYQTGSARLGVVDLFACEIATLCRVAAVVDMVPRYIALFHAGPGSREPLHAIDGDLPTDGRFTSQESYFPVFDASVKDLQPLEAGVVDNVTAFYTYMKVMRDSLRKLAEIHPSAGGSSGADEWHRAICNVIYMQFLGLESARKAIRDLVEFEPTEAEDVFTILLSELVAYGFLREQFTGDLKQRRLEARDESYRQEIPRLYYKLLQQDGTQWEKAKDVAAEVMKRYAEVFATDAPSPIAPEPPLAAVAAREDALSA
ncbi:MAG: hypothetical protein WA184_20175 [Stellaceae bacterium]